LIEDADPIGSGRRTSLPPSPNPEPSPEVEPMHDLAPDIIRERILIEGYYTVTIDEDVIRKFFAHITTLLDLRTYDAPVIFAPGGEGRVDNEGYDAFVPLIDSGISLYVCCAAAMVMPIRARRRAVAGWPGRHSHKLARKARTGSGGPQARPRR
jgi:hypothetical protein